MQRVLLAIDDELYKKIKANAKLEKRVITNYIRTLLENMFSYNNIILSNDLLNYRCDAKKYESYTDDISFKSEVASSTKQNDSDEYNDYIELEKLGMKLRLENGESSDDGISDHERGWLHKNPNKTIEDYREIFKDVF